MRKAVPARSSGSRPPLFFVPTGFGDHSYVFELAKEIDKTFPVYAVPWPAMEEKPATMSDMAASAVALIREVQPQGHTIWRGTLPAGCWPMPSPSSCNRPGKRSPSWG